MSSYSEDHLEHFGVKGMKWGVRKDRKNSSGGGKAEKEPSKRKLRNESIKKARIDVKKTEKKLGRAEEKYYSAKTKAGEKKAKAELDKLEDQYLSQRSLAKKTTTGEKWMIGATAWFAVNIIATLANPTNYS